MHNAARVIQNAWKSFTDRPSQLEGQITLEQLFLSIKLNGMKEFIDHINFYGRWPQSCAKRIQRKWRSYIARKRFLQLIEEFRIKRRQDIINNTRIVELCWQKYRAMKKSKKVRGNAERYRALNQIRLRLCCQVIWKHWQLNKKAWYRRKRREAARTLRKEAVMQGVSKFVVDKNTGMLYTNIKTKGNDPNYIELTMSEVEKLSTASRCSNGFGDTKRSKDMSPFEESERFRSKADWSTLGSLDDSRNRLMNMCQHNALPNALTGLF